jgi:ABC-type polysaccharide/polyol phosphate export permease
VKNVVQQIIEHRELLWNLTGRELKLRYRGSLLGFLWSILIPLFMAAHLCGLPAPAGRARRALADIIIGVFAWQFTVQCVNGGLGASPATPTWSRRSPSRA